jgi:predicted transcriptional regulator
VFFANHAEKLAGRPLVVHDAGGLPVSETETEIEPKPLAGTVVTVPVGGFVTVVDQGTPTHVYTAKVVAGVETVRFLSQGDDGNTNAFMSSPIVMNCGVPQCAPGGYAEVHRSCETTAIINLPVGGPYPSLMTSQSTNGCPEAPEVQTTVVVYATDGTILRAGTEASMLPDAPSLSVLELSAPQIQDVSIALGAANNLEGWVNDDTRLVSRDGFGRPIRTWETTTSSITLVKALASNLLLRRSFLQDANISRTITRLEDYDIDDAMPPFTFEEGVVFSALENLNVTLPYQPSVPWELTGPVGDLLLFDISQIGGARTWHVMIPATSSGEVLLPRLPSDLEDLAISTPGLGIHAHFDVAGGYAEAVAAGLGVTAQSRSLPLPMTVSTIFGQY